MLALIAAEAREFAGVLRHAEGVTRLDCKLDFARSARLNGREVMLVANGPGPKLAAKAAEAAKEHSDLEGLVSVGFCGALNPILKPGEVLVASAITSNGLSVPRSHPSACQMGKLLSLDRVATTAEEKQKLHQQTAADAIEMEAAAVAGKAVEWEVPCYAIKAVTDTASESFPLDFNGLRDGNGRFSRGKIIWAAARRPAVIPALMRLDRRCKLAAEALGDFLAGTSF